jgi:hypothetical protein
MDPSLAPKLEARGCKYKQPGTGTGHHPTNPILANADQAGPSATNADTHGSALSTSKLYNLHHSDEALLLDVPILQLDNTITRF